MTGPDIGKRTGGDRRPECLLGRGIGRVGDNARSVESVRKAGESIAERH